MPLSYDWTALNAKIDAMTPGGNTNQTIGLQWGFQSLTAAPFTIPAKDPNYTYNQVIILLTDGLNTQNRLATTDAVGDRRPHRRRLATTSRRPASRSTPLQVNTDGDPTSTMLQQLRDRYRQVLHGDVGRRRSARSSTRSAPTCRSCASRSNSGDDFAEAGRLRRPHCVEFAGIRGKSERSRNKYRNPDVSHDWQHQQGWGLSPCRFVHSRCFRSFLQDRRGGVVPMFALAIIPVIGLVGAAVDYSRANSIRSGVQGALDATALAMARSAPTLTETELRRKASALFRGAVQPARGQEPHRHAAYTHDQRLEPDADGVRQHGHDVHARDGLHADQVGTRRRSNGATSACASRLRSTPPARWRAPARSMRSRPRPRTCSTS